MRITYFKIENFRNIKLAECNNPPDFIVICGGNGCGKSAFLQALMTAKEHAGSYGHFTHDPRAVSADATKATISMTLSFSDAERDFVKERQWGGDCPAQDEVIVEIEKGGRGKAIKRSTPVHNLLGWYSRQYFNSPGFFDFIEAYRLSPKKQLSTWDAASLSDDRAKYTLGAQGSEKFQFTKEYLASLVMQDLQEIQRAQRHGQVNIPDSVKPIRDFFNGFFAPMIFKEIRIDVSPFQYIIGTPRGDIDIDDLSGGEKEVLNMFIRFHQMNPKGSVVLFDEADAHLHPDLERRYLEVLRTLGKGNQLWITTHSPEMMIAAGSESLYTILKEPIVAGGNQFVRVTNDELLHDVLSEIMGSRGLVSFNQRIVFIEGEESSTDREIYEKFYPPGQYNVSFVPAGNSATVRKTAEQVNYLLSNPLGFQEYYSIVDGDIERAENMATTSKLFQLPVYHIENFLINTELILETAKEMLGSACPYGSALEIETELKNLILQDHHFKSFTKALHDAKIAKLAKEAHDSIYKGSAQQLTIPKFADTEIEAKSILNEYLEKEQWQKRCKGRDLLKAFCGKHDLKYQHFRNSLIAKMKEPPESLNEIMNTICKKQVSANSEQIGSKTVG